MLCWYSWVWWANYGMRHSGCCEERCIPWPSRVLFFYVWVFVFFGCFCRKKSHQVNAIANSSDGVWYQWKSSTSNIVCKMMEFVSFIELLAPLILHFGWTRSLEQPLSLANPSIHMKVKGNATAPITLIKHGVEGMVGHRLLKATPVGLQVQVRHGSKSKTTKNKRRTWG